MLDLFWEASTERRFDGASIPASAIRAAARDAGLTDPDDARRLRVLFRRLDDVFLQHRADQFQREREAMKPMSKKRPKAKRD